MVGAEVKVGQGGVFGDIDVSELVVGEVKAGQGGHFFKATSVLDFFGVWFIVARTSKVSYTLELFGGRSSFSNVICTDFVYYTIVEINICEWLAFWDGRYICIGISRREPHHSKWNRKESNYLQNSFSHFFMFLFVLYNLYAYMIPSPGGFVKRGNDGIIII